MELLSKALLYTEVEAHWQGSSLTAKCRSSFSLLERHVCSSDPHATGTSVAHQANRTMEAGLPAAQPHVNGATGMNGATDSVTKRKATTPTIDEAPKEKRARTVPPDESMRVDGSSSLAAGRERISSTHLQSSDWFLSETHSRASPIIHSIRIF